MPATAYAEYVCPFCGTETGDFPAHLRWSCVPVKAWRRDAGLPSEGYGFTPAEYGRIDA